MSKRDRKPLGGVWTRPVTVERTHDRVNVGDRVLVSYGIVTVTAKTVRDDGYVVYSYESGEPVHAVNPSQTVTVVTAGGYSDPLPREPTPPEPAGAV